MDTSLPEGGSIIHFGDYRVYVAVVTEVLTFSKPSFVEVGSCDRSAGSRTYVEVPVTGSDGGEDLGGRNGRPLLHARYVKPGPCPWL